MDPKQIKEFKLRSEEYLTQDHLFLDGMIIGLLPMPTEPSVLTKVVDGKVPLLVAPAKAQALPRHIAGLADHERVVRDLARNLERPNTRPTLASEITFDGFEAQINFIQ